MLEIARDLDNLLAAGDWLLLRRGLDELYRLTMELLWLCGQLGWYHALLSLLDRGISVLKALTLSGPADSVAQRKRNLVLSVLLMNKGEVFQRIGPLTRARTYQEEAEKLLRNAESQDERWFEARWRLGRIQAMQWYREGHFPEATDVFRSLLSELEAGGLKMWPYSDEAAYIWRAEISYMLGYQAWALGRYEEACRYTEQSKAFSKQIASEWGAALSSATRTLALFYTGKYEQAEIEALHGVRVMRAFGDRFCGSACMSALGRLYVAWGKYDRARIYGRRLLALAYPFGLQVQSASALCILGAVELALGNVGRAKERYEAARAQYQRSGSAESVGYAACLVGAGGVALAEGDLTAAHEHLRGALISTTCTRGDAADAVMILAQAFLTEGHLERATELLAFVVVCPPTQHSTREQARKLLDDLETRVLPEVFAAAVTRGRARQVDEVVAELVGG
jgi:tetratricopeptide (TPR) repeat protein